MSSKNGDFEHCVLPEEQLHCSGKRLEVDLVVEGSCVLDVSEDGHPDDGVDESDEGQESTDVEQGGEGDHEGEQELPDPLGGLDQPQDTTDTEHPHHPEQGGRHREILCFKKNKISKCTIE